MEDKVFSILRQICGTEEVINNKDIDLFKTGLIDSLGVVELVVRIEEELGIILDPAEIDREDIETPNKLLKYLVDFAN